MAGRHLFLMLITFSLIFWIRVLFMRGSASIMACLLSIIALCFSADPLKLMLLTSELKCIMPMVRMTRFTEIITHAFMFLFRSHAAACLASLWLVGGSAEPAKMLRQHKFVTARCPREVCPSAP